jgi:DNA-binding CsgD family transcriptional regulator
MAHSIDWNIARRGLEGQLTPEEQRIVEMLAAGKTQPEIGCALGQHRSMVWRKVQRIKAKLEAQKH